MAMLKVSEGVIPIVMEFEGFKEKAYLDAVGVPTIGYGTTRYANGKKVRLGDHITEADARKLMIQQLQEHLDDVAYLIHDDVELSQNQIDAIASFVYNVGASAFANSTLLKRINEQKLVEAAREFRKWNKGRVNGELVVLNGLTRRRSHEEELFLS